MEACPICSRVLELTKHHIIPKIKKGKNIEDNYFWLCVDCHAQIHLLYDENYIRDNLNTKELILADEKLYKFGKFAAKQKYNIKKKESSNKKKKRR